MPAETVPAEAKDGSAAAPADRATHRAQPAAPAGGPHPGTTPGPSEAMPASHPLRRWLLLAGALVGLAAAAYFLVPWVVTALNTVSTDDAYVNGHVTFVAPRVAGQVARVLVDDNDRVHKGDLLVQLDKEPYQVQLNVAQAAVAAAQADLVAAQAQVRGTAGQVRSLRFGLEHAIEDVDNQIALLRSRVATWQAQKSTLVKAESDYDRVKSLVDRGAAAKEELDFRREALEVAQARVEEALQGIYQVRVALGLPPRPKAGDDLAHVPPDLDQTFSSTRQAQMNLVQAAAQLGVADSFNKSPRQMVADFYKRDPQGDIDRIYEHLFKDAPAVKQAETKLAQARRNLEQAELNFRYCDVVSDIDGVVTSRNVNPGNYVQVGQNLMAVRSLTEIWIDANFKETQLEDLRIGHRVRCEVDMYGTRREFEGRITGFTMGTGQTLALLPPQNATGNFVKIVQRLPVRVELTDYDPDKVPLFVGLSVTPYVYYKEPPTGPHAGDVLRPRGPLPQLPTDPKP
jgi:membrane fusion protein (multidrug efflux system)